MPDDQRRLPGSAEGAAQKDRCGRLARQLDGERPAHGGGLLAAAGGEGGIFAALQAALEVPGRLAVAEQVERGGERHGVRRRITILASP